MTEARLKEIDMQIREHLQTEKGYAQLAMSIPGVGEKATFALMAFIGDGKRFSNASQVANYAGLTPTVNISGQKVHYGLITLTFLKTHFS